MRKDREDHRDDIGRQRDVEPALAIIAGTARSEGLQPSGF